MRPHDLDVVSLLAGLVFLMLGGVGLLQAAGVVESGAPWAVIGAIAAVGVTGIVVSLRRLVSPGAAGPSLQRSPVPETPDPWAPDDEPEPPEPPVPGDEVETTEAIDAEADADIDADGAAV